MKLTVQNLSKKFNDQQVFSGVNFSLREGQLKLLFGPSGSGKTTLIRTIAEFVSATTGTIRLDGKSQSHYDPQSWRRQVVLLHQEPRMFPGSVKENIELAAEYHNIEINSDKLLSQCALDVDPDQPANSLSGGEKKRVSLARALAINPSFLLLDEPTAFLHENARITIDELILDLVDSENLGVMWITHNTDECKKLGASGYKLKNGKWSELNLTED